MSLSGTSTGTPSIMQEILQMVLQGISPGPAPTGVIRTHCARYYSRPDVTSPRVIRLGSRCQAALVLYFQSILATSTHESELIAMNMAARSHVASLVAQMKSAITVPVPAHTMGSTSTSMN